MRIDNPAELNWRRAVAFAANTAMVGREMYQGGVVLLLTFVAVRAASHRTSKGALRKGAPLLPASKPDVDKLLRSVCDSLTGIVYRDDAQVTLALVAKRFGPTAGVYVEIASDTEGPALTALLGVMTFQEPLALPNSARSLTLGGAKPDGGTP